MITQAKLRRLSGMVPSFPLIAACLRGATTETSSARAGLSYNRTHLILSADAFPAVTIGVEGTETPPVTRLLFKTNAYAGASWDLSAPAYETMLRTLIAERSRDEMLSRSVHEATLHRQQVARAAVERDAMVARTSGLQEGARRRMLEASRASKLVERSDSKLEELNILLDWIAREADRAFVVELTVRRHQKPGFAFTGPQLRWLDDIWLRTALLLDRVPLRA